MAMWLNRHPAGHAPSQDVLLFSAGFNNTCQGRKGSYSGYMMTQNCRETTSTHTFFLMLIQIYTQVYPAMTHTTLDVKDKCLRLKEVANNCITIVADLQLLQG